jgi:hypothetical protein
MRRIMLDCKHQRGCGYCADVIPYEDKGTWRTKSKCPYDECPYHELNSVKSYEEYIKEVSDVSIPRLINRLCRAI